MTRTLTIFAILAGLGMAATSASAYEGSSYSGWAERVFTASTDGR